MVFEPIPLYLGVQTYDLLKNGLKLPHFLLCLR